MEKTNYQTPLLEVTELIVEQGFASSPANGAHESSKWSDFEF